MDVFYDTEFLERGSQYPVSLISIGLVARDGREYYAINCNAPWKDIIRHPWLRENVVPHLPGELDDSGGWVPDIFHKDMKPPNMIADEVASFLLASRTEDNAYPLELWADCGGYDRVVLAQLWNTMVEMPDFIPYWQHELRSMMAMWRIKDEALPPIPENTTHNALGDARHLRTQVQFCLRVLDEMSS